MSEIDARRFYSAYWHLGNVAVRNANCDIIVYWNVYKTLFSNAFKILFFKKLALAWYKAQSHYINSSMGDDIFYQNGLSFLFKKFFLYFLCDIIEMYSSKYEFMQSIVRIFLYFRLFLSNVYTKWSALTFEILGYNPWS